MQDPIDRNAYFYFNEITTRWMDNDVYGHVNNVTYYSYFDTIANSYLIEQGGLDIESTEDVGFVVASSCQYLASIQFPDKIEAAFRVNKLGTKSVEYGIAIFKQGAAQASAHGTFTHVFVNRASGKSTPIPEKIRHALELAII